MKIAIIGGGIAGLSAAIALRELEVEIDIFESAPQLGEVGAGLVLAANAVRALRTLGIDEIVLSQGNEIEEMRILDAAGRIITSTDNRALRSRMGLPANFAIHRADLHAALRAQLGEARLHTGKRCRDFKLFTGGVGLEFEDGSSHRADFLLAADGVHSLFRQRLLPGAGVRYAGYTCWRAVIDGWEGMPLQHQATESWGAGRRFGIVPLTDQRLYWFATLNAAQPDDPTYQKYKVADLQEAFGTFHDPISKVLSRTSDDHLLWNDIVDVRPIRRYAFGRVLLIGDAAHATTPNMGQGACQALEDSAILQSLLSGAGDLERTFQLFEQQRIPRATWVVNTSYRLGRLGQLEKSWLLGLRNALLRRLPGSIQRRQLDRLLEVQF